MDEFYWEIIERDGTKTRIPPASVQTVQKLWTENQPVHTKTRSIPASQIVSFHITAERFSEVPLIEAAAQAFKEPMFTDDAIQAHWVKIIVPMDKWHRYYSSSPGYKYLGDINGMAEIAFRKATHEIDINKTPYLTAEEIKQVDK